VGFFRKMREKKVSRSILVQLIQLVQVNVLMAVVLFAGVTYWGFDLAGREFLQAQTFALGQTLAKVAEADLKRNEPQLFSFRSTAKDLVAGAGGQVTRVFAQRLNGVVVASTDDLVDQKLDDPATQLALMATPNQPVFQMLAEQGVFEGAVAVEHEGKVWGVIRFQVPSAVLAEKQMMVLIPLAVVTVVIVAISGFIAFLRARHMAKPLVFLAEQARKVAAGDLTVRAQVQKASNEVEALAAAFDTMACNIRSLVQEIQAASDQVADSSQHLAAGAAEAARAVEHISAVGADINERAASQASDAQSAAAVMAELAEAIDQIARGAVDQATGMSQASGLTDQMAVVVKRIGREIEEVTSAARAALVAAGNGQEAVTASGGGMERIRQAVDEVAQQMERLSQSSARIHEVIALIGEIAEQTNLLALNAAIEAARAGEAGRGFAVVADEVRRLAARTQNAAGEVTRLVQAIQTGTQQVLAAVDRGTAETQSGSELAVRAAAALDEIVRSVQETEQRASTIVQDAKGLVEASGQVQAAIAEVAAVAEENSAAAEEMMAGSTQVQQLVGHVGQVSRETAGVVQGVSQDIHRLSANTEEITASAEMLAEAAARLQAATRRFRV
jgi:methyl-accepting chemotaxis protein